jgi:hypothetical protein
MRVTVVASAATNLQPTCNLSDKAVSRMVVSWAFSSGRLFTGLLYPQTSVNGPGLGAPALEAKALPVVSDSRRGLWAVAVLFTPELVLAVEPCSWHVLVCVTDAPVLNEEGRHVVVLPELLGGVLHAFGDLEVSSLCKTV